MTWILAVWSALLSVALYLVFRKADEVRGLQWRVEELRRELDVTKGHLAEIRKKLERVSLPA